MSDDKDTVDAQAKDGLANLFKDADLNASFAEIENAHRAAIVDPKTGRVKGPREFTSANLRDGSDNIDTGNWVPPSHDDLDSVGKKMWLKIVATVVIAVAVIVGLVAISM